jgi:hypothetical protein
MLPQKSYDEDNALLVDEEDSNEKVNIGKVKTPMMSVRKEKHSAPN